MVASAIGGEHRPVVLPDSRRVAMRRWQVLTAALALAVSSGQWPVAGAAAPSSAPVFPVGTHLTADFPYGLTQAEPSIRVDDTGRLYVMAPGSTPIGCELWT